MQRGFTNAFSNGVITKHESTNGCWIDGNVNSSLHDHHIIPQNAGGTNGPIARLCSSCHDGVHDAAKSKIYANVYCERVDAKAHWVNVEQKQRADFLIKTIMRSEALAAQSKHKTIKINLTLLADENARLEHLAKRLGKSKVNTIKMLILRGF